MISNKTEGMKYNKTLFIILLFLPALSVGCRRTSPMMERQAMLFEMESVKYSPDYLHKGFIIDSDGNVFEYRNPDKWNFPDRDLRISESQVAANLASCQYTEIKIPVDELLRYSNHIKNIAASKISAMKDVSDNAGITRYICYEYNEGNGTYKGYIIKMEGDHSCENLNFFSKRITDWMNGIDNTLSANSGFSSDMR
jgi:hypothetical protein